MANPLRNGNKNKSAPALASEVKNQIIESQEQCVGSYDQLNVRIGGCQVSSVFRLSNGSGIGQDCRPGQRQTAARSCLKSRSLTYCSRCSKAFLRYIE